MAKSDQQNYRVQRKICLASNKLFEDPLFPVPSENASVKWLRPHEFSAEPKFIADGVSRFDVQQGDVGDCWFVAAMANLTLNDKQFNQVVPSDQSFEAGKYCGMFRFNFWRFGRWIEVVIDDRLPVRLGCHSPMYVRSSDPNEFWSPLLEKAYAKFYSSYVALNGGDICEALVDFTGGMAEQIDLRVSDQPANLWTLLKKSFERGSMLGCSIMKKDVRLSTYGLISYHAYSITNVLELQVRDIVVPLLRVRNPWGQKEWTGAWSDRSNRWLDISESEQMRIGLQVQDDGEFWISFDDWKRIFTNCEICHLTPEAADSEVKHRWYARHLEGSWIWGLSSGGHLLPHNAKQFATNPQYFIELTESDLDDTSGRCTLVVSMMQKDHRVTNKGFNAVLIGFYVFLVSRKCLQSTEHLFETFFTQNQPINMNPIFTFEREVSARFHLSPGCYIIVPTTYDADAEAQFMLRIWTEHPIRLVESIRNESLAYVKAQAANQDLNITPVRSRLAADSAQLRNTDDAFYSGAPARSNISSRPYMYSEHLDLDLADIQYPDLSYPGKPNVVNHRRFEVTSNRRAMISIERKGELVNQTPSVKKKRSLWQKVIRSRPIGWKNSQ